MFMPAALISSALAPERSINSNLFLRLTDSANAAFNSSTELNFRSLTISLFYYQVQRYGILFISTKYFAINLASFVPFSV